MTTAQLCGCDVDRKAIAWGRTQYPGIRWLESSFLPPLPMAASSFDLVYSISVFSHLDEPAQDHWLREIARVLRPKGLALLSVHGEYAYDRLAAGQFRSAWCASKPLDGRPLSERGFYFQPYLRSIWNARELAGIEGHFGVAFQSERYIRDHWSKHMPVIEVAPRAMTGWQDVVVLVRGS